MPPSTPVNSSDTQASPPGCVPPSREPIASPPLPLIVPRALGPMISVSEPQPASDASAAAQRNVMTREIFQVARMSFSGRAR